MCFARLVIEVESCQGPAGAGSLDDLDLAVFYDRRAANAPLPDSLFDPRGKRKFRVQPNSGQVASGNQVATCLNNPAPDLPSLGACLTPYNLHIGYTYQPAGNYRPLQWYETGIYLALATLLGATCFWRIRRHRD